MISLRRGYGYLGFVYDARQIRLIVQQIKSDHYESRSDGSVPDRPSWLGSRHINWSNALHSPPGNKNVFHLSFPAPKLVTANTHSP